MPRKYTYDEVKQYIIDNENILLSDEYINSKEKLKIKCKNSHEYLMNLHDFKSGCRCPICYKEKREISQADVEDYLGAYGYKLIGPYKNTQEKIKILCPNNHITEMAFCQFKSNGHRCRFCVGNNIRNDYNYIKNTLFEHGYILLEEQYVNNTQKLNMICPQGHKIKMSWTLFKMGVRCQECNCSSGELEIIRVLDNNNIDYIPQFTFSDCRDKKVLPFDFIFPRIIYVLNLMENNIIGHLRDLVVKTD